MNFKEYILSEAVLHPELKEIISSSSTNSKTKKLETIKQKIQELTKRGESTGLEKNMPEGSSRAFLEHSEPAVITIDGKPLQQVKMGTKIAINAPLDPYHDHTKYKNLKLGALQNKVELGGDKQINQEYRILIQDKNNPHEYRTNEEKGIFPPLIDHDYENHEWTQIGVCKTIKESDFPKLTQESGFTSGITFNEFFSVLRRIFLKIRGNYNKQNDNIEKKLTNIEENHPLVKRFVEYHKTGISPMDYQDIKNLGVFTHPITKKKYIVARDHGFSIDVDKAYQRARMNQSSKKKI